MARLLIAEDEPAAREPLARALRREGHEVDEVCNGAEAVRRAETGTHAVVLLDVGLPGLDGLEACRRIRAVQPRVGIVMLTGHTGELDVVAGLEAGADDYVGKPFRIAELLARVRAQVRRCEDAELRGGDIRIERHERRAWLAGRELDLCPKEFDLLTYMLVNAGNVLERDQILAAVWGGRWYGSRKALDMVVMQLRRKLGEPANAPRHIYTVRGVGFRFEP